MPLQFEGKAAAGSNSENQRVETHACATEEHTCVCVDNLHPLLKGETLKKWLGDIFENRPGGHFQKSLKKGVTFQKKGSVFKLSLKKIPHWGLGPGPWPGYFFKLSLKMDPFFKIV